MKPGEKPNDAENEFKCRSCGHSTDRYMSKCPECEKLFTIFKYDPTTTIAVPRDLLERIHREVGSITKIWGTKLCTRLIRDLKTVEELLK